MIKLSKSMIKKSHESCKNHILQQKINPDKVNSEKCPVEIHIKCLKEHNLFETHPNCCEDYELTNEPFAWKLNVMKEITKDSFKKMTNGE